MTPHPLRFAVLAAIAAPALVGCYSREHLIEHARDRATREWVDEIDLGTFRVTLPTDESTGDITEVDVHLFGEAPRYQHNEIAELLESRKPMIEDVAYTTLRSTPNAQLIEPELLTLRGRLRKAFNEHLGETPLTGIGFYNIRFLRH